MCARSAPGAPPSQQLPERLDRALEHFELLVVEAAQPLGQPGRAARANTLQQPLALTGEREADAAPVTLVADTLEQPCLLEPVDMAREGGSGDPLLGGELAQA